MEWDKTKSDRLIHRGRGINDFDVLDILDILDVLNISEFLSASWVIWETFWTFCELWTLWTLDPIWALTLNVALDSIVNNRTLGKDRMGFRMFNEVKTVLNEHSQHPCKNHDGFEKHEHRILCELVFFPCAVIN